MYYVLYINMSNFNLTHQPEDDWKKLKETTENKYEKRKWFESKIILSDNIKYCVKILTYSKHKIVIGKII